MKQREARMQEGTRYTKRCRRWDIPGQAHALTFSCYRSRPFLSQEHTCVWLAEALNRARQRYAFELWAYVFMPNHVHLVLHPTREGYSISRILLAIKQPVSRQGLVATAAEWRYSSAAAWEGVDTGPLAIDRDSFPAF